MNAADVVISRSSAGTIAELTARGKAAVRIPLASAAGSKGGSGGSDPWFCSRSPSRRPMVIG
ncbi:MAG: glycosyltransferase [Actinoallomurus sp.]